MQEPLDNPVTIPFFSAAQQISRLKAKNDKQKTIEKPPRRLHAAR
jgi:hypothetical protein